MGVRVGPERRLSTEELMGLNYGAGEDSWESLGQQGGQASPSYRKSVLNIHWKDWCWSWNSNTLATWLEKTLMLGKIEGRRRGWERQNSWMASPTQWTWVWANSGRWWGPGKPGVLQATGSQLSNWIIKKKLKYFSKNYFFKSSELYYPEVAPVLSLRKANQI